MNILFKKSVSMVALATMLTSSVPAAFAAVTIADGDLVKASGSSAVYLVKGSTLRTFPYSTIYHSWGFPSNYSTVKTVAASDLASYTVGDPVPFRDGTCFRGTAKSLPGFESQAVFCVSDGQLRPVESQNAFFGLFNVTNWTQGNKYVQYIPDDFLSKFDFAFGTKVSESEINSGTLMNGLVVKGSVDGAYYLVQDGKLRSISTAAASANKIDLSKAVVTAQTKINAISSALPVSTTVEASLVTPKTKAEAQAGATTTDTTKAAKLVVSADKTSVEADGATKVTVTAKVATNEGATVSTATNSVTFAITSGTGTLSATTVAAVNGVATITLTPSTVSGTIVVSATATGLTASTVSITATANTLAPTVTSVANQGMRIINVSFDKTLDKTTAQTTSNYTVRNNKSSTITVSSAKLLSDAKTVQLFLASGAYNDSSVDSIEVKNIQNAAQTSTMTTVTKELTIADSSVPTVVAVEALGSKAIRVTFSEAVQYVKSISGTPATDVSVAGQTYGAFRLDDKAVSYGTGSTDTADIEGVTVTYPDATDYTKALISFANPISVGAHTLTVSYNGVIKDFNVTTDNSINANTMQPAGYVATVAADTSVPTLSSVEVLTQTKARYTFSKAINLDVASDYSKFFWSTSSSVTSGTYATSLEKVSDTVYEATWGTAITTGTVYFYAGAVTDYSGNSISPLPSNKSVSVTSDTAPAISSVSMDTDSDNKVVVYFNKDVENASAINTSNYVFKKADGTILTATTGGDSINSNGNPTGNIAQDATNKKKITITLGGNEEADASALPGGTYQLTISGVKTSGGTVAMSAASYTFTVTDKTRPSLSSTATTKLLAGSHRIVVKYSEAMGSSALSAVNYKIVGTTGGVATTTLTKLSDISGVSLSFRNSNKDVVIDFPTSETIVATTSLTIGYIDGSTMYTPTDVSGNLFKDSTGTLAATQTIVTSVANAGFSAANMNFNDATPSNVVKSIKVLTATTVEVKFARDLDTVNASEFLIKSAASSSTWMTPTNAVIDADDNSKVVFTIPSGTSYEFTSVDGYTSVSIKLNSSATTGSPAYTTATTKDLLGLYLVAQTTAAQSITSDNSTITYKNDIRPIIKSWVFNSSNSISIAFDGKVNPTTFTNDQLVLTQTVNGTTITASTWTTTQTTASNIVTFTTTTSGLDSNSSATLKTLSDGYIVAVGANGARIASNTTGLVNAAFVASSISSGYGVATATIAFNQNVDSSSIISGWTDGKVAKTVTGSVIIDATGNLTFSGVTLGEFKTTGWAAGTYNATYVFTDTTAATKTLLITVAGNGTSTTPTTVIGASTSYEPTSSIKTTGGATLTTDFKPSL